MKVYTQQTGTRRLEPTYTTFVELTEKEAARLDRELGDIEGYDPRIMRTASRLGDLLADDLAFHHKMRGKTG